jgi:hypothetical protein
VYNRSTGALSVLALLRWIRLPRRTRRTHYMKEDQQTGNLPHNSEAFGILPHSAEGFGTIPHGAERYGTVRNFAERKENHTLTVRQAARMFEAAGVGRTERSIINWCQPNKAGVARLDCYFDPNERKYYITPQSIELAIADEKSKGAVSQTQGAADQTVSFEAVRSKPRRKLVRARIFRNARVEKRNNGPQNR